MVMTFCLNSTPKSWSEVWCDFESLIIIISSPSSRPNLAAIEFAFYSEFGTISEQVKKRANIDNWLEFDENSRGP